MKYLILLLLLLTDGVFAAIEFKEYDKEAADNGLAEMIKIQDDSKSRSKNHSYIHLQRRKIAQHNGIDEALQNKRGTVNDPLLIITRLDRYPSTKDWTNWSQSGIEFINYLGKQHWLIYVKIDVQKAYNKINAEAFSMIQIMDKIAPSLDNYQAAKSFYNKSHNSVVINVSLINDTDSADIKQSYHRGTLAFVDNSSSNIMTVVTAPDNIKKIAARKDVLMITPGQWEVQPLMAEARARVKADNIIGAHGLPLTGQGIKMANDEGISATHPDFRDANSVGRWTQLAQNSCLNGTKHGRMTGGIMLGNGASSVDFYGQPNEYRGVAPQAIFECFGHLAARANVSSYSKVRNGCRQYNTSIDKEVLGLVTENKFHAQVMAAGSNGQGSQNCNPEKGYFSIVNPNKNPMVVGLGQLNGDINSYSSVGPTFDGRIKPDIIAATSNHAYPEGEFKMVIERIQLIRDGFIPQVIYNWDFSHPHPQSSSWNMGWGETYRGNQFVDFYRTIRSHLGLTIEPQPWNSYNEKPILGTIISPDGGNLSQTNFLGQQNDILRVVYRAIDNKAGFFNLRASWFRSLPDQNNHPEDWRSQGHIDMLGYADNSWRTIDIPVGKAKRVFSDPDDAIPWITNESWEGHPIHYLALNITANKGQMTPDHATTSFPTIEVQEIYQRAGGTSAASPVVAGGYALALEQQKLLYPATDLEARSMNSVYHYSAANIGPPKNSTLKGLFVHTADDVTQDQYDFYMLDNPDTENLPSQYHKGPDYTTGYGMVNIRKAIGHLTKAAAQNNTTHYIIENELPQNGVHQYTINIDEIPVSLKATLKVTLVWDDAPSSDVSHVTEPKLVNNLGLLVKSPFNRFRHPWSLDLPYDIYDPSIGLPTDIEPEPINISPARRNIPNDRDNVEQVEVALFQNSLGQWTIYVSDNGMGDTSTFPKQSYSLIISSR